MALDFWFPLPYGSYSLTGTGRLYVRELGEWEQFSGSRCSIAFDFPEPEFCETTDPQFGVPIPLTRDFSTKIDGVFDIALSSRIGSCSSAGSPKVTGNLSRTSVSQCCEDEEMHESGEALQGNVGLNVPGITCSTPSLRVPLLGIPNAVRISFGADLSGSARASASGSPALCGASGISASIAGSVSGTLAATVTAAILHDNLISASGSASATLTASFASSSISQITTSGCAGPIVVSGTVSIGGQEGFVREFDADIPNSTFCF